MAWLESMLGMELSPTAEISLLLVIAAVGLAALYWIYRVLTGGPARLSRNRQPRLSVTDAAAVDDKRRLVLVRRDNTEHLILIGGPTDIVIEQGIVKERVAKAEADIKTAPEARREGVAVPTAAKHPATPPTAKTESISDSKELKGETEKPSTPLVSEPVRSNAANRLLAEDPHGTGPKTKADDRAVPVAETTATSEDRPEAARGSGSATVEPEVRERPADSHGPDVERREPAMEVSDTSDKKSAQADDEMQRLLDELSSNRANRQP